MNKPTPDRDLRRISLRFRCEENYVVSHYVAEFWNTFAAQWFFYIFHSQLF